MLPKLAQISKTKGRLGGVLAGLMIVAAGLGWWWGIEKQKLVVESVDPQITIKEWDRKWMLQKLNEWGVYSRANAQVFDSAAGKYEWKRVKSVRIVVVPWEQSGSEIYDKSEEGEYTVISSAYSKINDKNRIEITIFMDKNYLTKEGAEKASSSFAGLMYQQLMGMLGKSQLKTPQGSRDYMKKLVNEASSRPKAFVISLN